MRSITLSSSLLMFLLSLTSLVSVAQEIEICSGDSVELFLEDNYRGNLQWQQSTDSTTWNNIPNDTQNRVWVYPTTTTYYRAMVTEKDCDPIYSPIQKVVLNFETLTNFTLPSKDLFFMGDTLEFTVEGAGELRLYNNGKLINEITGDKIEIEADTTYNNFVLWAKYDNATCWATSDTINKFVQPFYHTEGENEYTYAVTKMPYELVGDSTGIKGLQVLDSFTPNYLNVGNTILVNDTLGGVLIYDSYVNEAGLTKLNGNTGTIFDIYTADTLILSVIDGNNSNERVSADNDCPHEVSLELDKYKDFIQVSFEDLCVQLEQSEITRTPIKNNSIFGDYAEVDYNIESITVSGKIKINVDITSQEGRLLEFKNILREQILFRKVLLIPNPRLRFLSGVLELVWIPELTAKLDLNSKFETALSFFTTIPFSSSKVRYSEFKLPETEFTIDTDNISSRPKIDFSADGDLEGKIVFDPFKLNLSYDILNAPIGPFVELETPSELTLQAGVEKNLGLTEPISLHRIGLDKNIELSVGGQVDFGNRFLKGKIESESSIWDGTAYATPNSISATAGNNQELERYGEELAEMLEVTVYDNFEDPVQIPTPVLFEVPDESNDLINGQKKVVIYTLDGKAKVAWQINEGSNLRITASVITPNKDNIKNSPVEFTVEESCAAALSNLPENWWETLEQPLKTKFNELLGRPIETDTVPSQVQTANLFCSTIEFDINGMLNRYKGLTDLSIIKYFKNLEVLDCSELALNTLDVSNNTKLKRLSCSDNNIVDLNLTGLDKLEGLYAFQNNYETLDLSTNISLNVIACGNTPLKSLLLPPNLEKVEVLNLASTNVEKLDLSTAINLRRLVTQNTKIKELNVSNSTSLNSLICSSESLISLDISNTSLRYFNRVNYSEGFVTTITVNNKAPLESFRAVNCKLLESVALNGQLVTDGKLENIEIADCPALISLDCGDTLIESLDLSSNNTALSYLNCWQSQLKTLNLSNITTLTELWCNGNQLKSLDVSGNTKLKRLRCWNNQLESLDVSGNTALWSLNCSNNKLATLDLSSNTALVALECENNQLENLDVSSLTNLRSLDCSGNELTSLDASNTSLPRLSISGNPLEILRAVNCDSLTSLSLNTTTLKSIDLSGCGALTSLSCSNNQLFSLNISSNTALESLNCSNNELSSLDISNNTALTRLSCQENLFSFNALKGIMDNLPPTFQKSNFTWSCERGVAADNGPDSNKPFEGSDCDKLRDYFNSKF